MIKFAQLILAGAMLMQAACASVANVDQPATHARTQQGVVEGSTADNIISWRGIEYARAQRWALPTPAPRFDGIKQATALGPACPQNGQERMVEDCLFLNVYTPAIRAPGQKLPVVVWFHGGGFRAGSGGDAPRLWAKEGLVTVSFNYRLGVLGFRDWPGWDADDHRNFGQADMVAALTWVRNNIAAFGGDPNQVTIHGHSAGGMAVALMLVDPRARGLFDRAIADASYGAWPFPKALNPSPQMRQTMRYAGLETEASLPDLVAKTPYFHLPIIGGPDLPDQPQALLATRQATIVPTIFGFTSFDGGGTLAGAGYNPETFLARFVDIAAVRALYAGDFNISDLQGAERIFGDVRYGISSRGAARAISARGGKAWLFYVTGPTNGEPGVRHGAYYRQLFGEHQTRPLPLGQYFINFARTGDPNTNALPNWPRHDGSGDQWMVFDPAPQATQGVLNVRLNALERAEMLP